MKGETRLINGDRWMIVDVAPAQQLAEMVAVLLEDAGFIVMIRGEGSDADVLTHLGSPGIGITNVLVPEGQGADALQLISETVTDYEGDELEAVLREGSIVTGAGAELNFDDEPFADDDLDDDDLDLLEENLGYRIKRKKKIKKSSSGDAGGEGDALRHRDPCGTDDRDPRVAPVTAALALDR